MPFLERPDPARQSGRRAAPPADAMAPRQEDALLHEVHLHAEHEEDVGDDARSAAGDPAPRRASRLARVARWAVSSFAAGAGPSSRASPPRPLLAASARGAELAVASGRVVRTFRDEDDFERLLGSYEVVPADAAEARACRGCGCVVARLAWAADGSALAVATLSGDVRVITRVGALVYHQRARDRPRAARAPVAGVALAAVPCDDPGGAAAPGRRWDLVVVVAADADPPAACVQRVVERSADADGIDSIRVLAR